LKARFDLDVARNNKIYVMLVPGFHVTDSPATDKGFSSWIHDCCRRANL
jgi:hypothetical protein